MNPRAYISLSFSISHNEAIICPGVKCTQSFDLWGNGVYSIGCKKKRGEKKNFSNEGWGPNIIYPIKIVLLSGTSFICRGLHKETIKIQESYLKY